MTSRATWLLLDGSFRRLSNLSTTESVAGLPAG